MLGKLARIESGQAVDACLGQHRQDRCRTLGEISGVFDIGTRFHQLRHLVALFPIHSQQVERIRIEVDASTFRLDPPPVAGAGQADLGGQQRGRNRPRRSVVGIDSDYQWPSGQNCFAQRHRTLLAPFRSIASSRELTRGKERIRSLRELQVPPRVEPNVQRASRLSLDTLHPEANNLRQRVSRGLRAIDNSFLRMHLKLAAELLHAPLDPDALSLRRRQPGIPPNDSHRVVLGDNQLSLDEVGSALSRFDPPRPHLARDVRVLSRNEFHG